MDDKLLNKYVPERKSQPSGSSVREKTFPAGLETVEDWAFAHREGLEKVTFCSVKRIARKLYLGSETLRLIVIPPSVTDIGWRAFPPQVRIIARPDSFAWRYAREHRILSDLPYEGEQAE